jgi:serine protease Do/serine protease DegQ
VSRQRAAVVTVRSSNGVGAGLVWDAARGLVVANAHLVRKADDIAIELADGSVHPASVYAIDQPSDVALLSAVVPSTPAPSFAKALPETGAATYALGPSAVVDGHVTDVLSTPESPAGGHVILTDRPIPVELSGSPLLDAGGSVVGLTNAGFPPPGAAGDVGLALPAREVIAIVEQLAGHREAGEALLGVRSRDLTGDERQHLGVAGGVLVKRVIPGSAAAAAGIRPGDVLLLLGGAQLFSLNDLVRQLRALEPGDRLTVHLLRAGREQTRSVTLA